MKAKEKRQVEGRSQKSREGTQRGARLARYLKKHPNFFVEHPELLEALSVPHVCGDAVSLVEYQVAALRERNRQLTRKIHELINNARGNEEINERLNNLTLKFISCSALGDVFTTLYQSLVQDFGADAATVRLFVPPLEEDGEPREEFAGDDPHAQSLFEHVLHASRPICGRLKPGQVKYLFGDGGGLGSGALLPLGEGKRFGLLAIASRESQRFHSGMATHFLERLSQILGRVVASHIDRG